MLFLLTIWISDCICLAHSRNQDEFSRRKFIFLLFKEAVQIWSLCKFSWSFGLQSLYAGSYLYYYCYFFNPLNTSWTCSGQMDPFRVRWNLPPIGEFSCKGGPLGHENLGFSRGPTSQGTPQNWSGQKFILEPEIWPGVQSWNFWWGVFIGNWVQSSRSQIFCKNKWKLMILFANT